MKRYSFLFLAVAILAPAYVFGSFGLPPPIWTIDGSNQITQATDAQVVRLTGVGTHSVVGNLEVKLNHEVENNLMAGDTAGTDQHDFAGEVDIGATFATHALKVENFGTGEVLQLRGVNSTTQQALEITDNFLERLVITSLGIVGLGTTELTSATAGDIVMANDTVDIRFENNAGNDTIPILSSNTSDEVLFNPSTGTLQVVTRDAVDTCGAGFRCLRVPN